MFFVNYLNRSETNAYRPLIECLYVVELAIISMDLILVYPLMYAVFSTKSYHLNIRLRVNGLLLQMSICSYARIVIIAHQIFGPIEYVEATYLLIASVLREAFKGYALGFITMLAIDRWIATLAWSWYESQRSTTILAFIPLECIQLAISWTMTLLLITEIINDQIFTLILAVLIISGICYYSVLVYNRRVVAGFKKGAQIQSYSVAKSYQFRENVAILNVLNLIAGPVALTALPCLVFYTFFSNIRADCGLNFIRYLLIALYDLWIAQGSLVFMISLLRSEPKFRKNASEFFVIKHLLKMMGMNVNNDSIHKVESHDANIYFAMLSRDLG